MNYVPDKLIKLPSVYYRFDYCITNKYFSYVNISLFHYPRPKEKFFIANTPGFLYFIYMEIEKPRITLFSPQLKIIPCILGLLVLLETSACSMYFTPYEDYIVPAFNLCSLPAHLCCRLKQ